MPDTRPAPPARPNSAFPNYRVWGQNADGDYDVLEERRTCPAPAEIQPYLADYVTLNVIAREAFPVYELTREDLLANQPEPRGTAQN